MRHRRRILCVFPRYAPSFGTFEHAYPLMDGVRALHAAAGHPGHRRLSAGGMGGAVRRREHPAGERGGFRLGRGRSSSAACTSSATRSWRSAAARAAAGKTTVLGGPSVSGLARALSRFRLSPRRRARRRDRRADRARSTPTRAPPPRTASSTTGERLPLADFPLPAYELIERPALFPRQRPVFERLPVSLRVLRHPGALRPPAAPQDAGADPRRARRDARRRDQRLDLFRRRQLHRQQEGGARAAAASRSRGRKRAAIRCSSSCEATLNIAKPPGDPGDDARGVFLHGLLRHRDAGAGGARRDAEIAQPHVPILDAVADDQQLRHGGRLGDHHGARHRHRRRPPSNLLDFIDRSNIPLLTINLLQALPNTPLWTRLAGGRAHRRRRRREFERRLRSPL